MDDNCRATPNCRNGNIACWYCTEAKEFIPLDRKGIVPEIIEQRRAERKAERKAKKDSEASRRGKASRNKGARREREFAKLIGGARVPLSGSMGGRYSNDVMGGEFGEIQWEVKSRKDGWKEIYTWILDEREAPDALALKADGKPWIAVFTFDGLRAWRLRWEREAAEAARREGLE